MRVIRIFQPGPLGAEQSVQLNDDACHHLVNVLRVKVGQPLVLFNGDGCDYPADVTAVGKRRVDVEVNARISLTTESPLALHLGQGVSKGDRMDFVLQKSVELGVTEITPLITERCNIKLNTERWEKKHQQWQKIIIGACEQSGRNVVPTLHPPVSLQDWLSQSTQQLRITLHPRAERGFADLPRPQQGCRLLIGPEGGLSDAEIHRTQEAGFDAVRLGPRVLRTETAALTSISILQSQFGDLA